MSARWICLALGACLSSSVAHAGLLGGFRVLPEYRSWSSTLEGDSTEVTISQIYLPAVATLRFARTVELVVAGGFAQSELEVEDGDSWSASGPSDVTAQLFARFLENRLLLQAGVELPSGLRELDSEQLTVLSSLSSPLLGFPLKNFGQGLGLTGGGALAFPLGSAALGIGAGFVQRGEFVLVEDGDDFNPGDELSVSAGLDFGARAEGGALDLGRAPLRLDAVYRTFGKDELDGVEIFQEGAQIEAQALAQTTGRALRLWALGRMVSKSDNKILQEAAGGQVAEIDQDAGLLTIVRGGVDFGLGKTTRIGVEGDWNQFTDAEVGALEGSTYGIGPVVRVGLGRDGLLRLGAKMLGGESDPIDENDPTLELDGLSASFALVWRPS